MKSRPSLSFYRLPSYPAMSQASDLAQAPAFNEKIIALKTASIDAAIARDTQLLVSLKSKGETFDFLPLDHFSRRSHDGQYHWGDITYRYRLENESAWI